MLIWRVRLSGAPTGYGSSGAVASPTPLDGGGWLRDSTSHGDGFTIDARWRLRGRAELDASAQRIRHGIAALSP